MGPSDDLASLSFKESDLITYRSALLVNLFMPNMVKPSDSKILGFSLQKSGNKAWPGELESNFGNAPHLSLIRVHGTAGRYYHGSQGR